ncbi:MAG: pyridoxamine 5'-phosphate oxidase family protein, partial [Candidatus Hodarchaeota archaeon]
KTFGILSTVSSKNKAHATGILYGVAPSDARFSIYLLTMQSYRKVANVKSNPAVSFVIPFPHYLRFIPSSCVQFQGTAEIIQYDDLEAQKVFNQKRILKMMLDQVNHLNMKEEAVFIKIKPRGKIFCYGIGISLIRLMRHIEAGSYSVLIPPERLYLS